MLVDRNWAVVGLDVSAAGGWLEKIVSPRCSVSDGWSLGWLERHEFPGPTLRRRTVASTMSIDTPSEHDTRKARSRFEAHLGTIDRILRRLSARYALGEDDEAAFRSETMIALIDNDYAVIRAFRGRSSLTTYLTVVVRRRLQDFCNRRWGRWRPSVAARRLGHEAVQLETLIARDGLTVDEAVSYLACRSDVTCSSEALMAMAMRLPVRQPRGMARYGSPDREAGTATADARLEAAARAVLIDRVGRSLERGLRRLSPDDRLLLELRFIDGWTIQRVARYLQVPSRPLYRRYRVLLRDLRRGLESDGLVWSEVHALFGDAPPDLLGRLRRALGQDTRTSSIRARAACLVP